MPTIGLELCDAGFLTAASDHTDTKLLAIADSKGATDWPGFAYHEGSQFSFGRAAEDMWFVHPRRVAHAFWSKLAHDTVSTLNIPTRSPSGSELSFFFLRGFIQQLIAASGPLEKIVLAVPGSYLKDAAAEEEKVGLLLGMAAELKLPLAGIVDMACAALCDPRAPGFNPTLPVVVVDVHLEGADFTVLTVEERLERKHFFHLPNSGYAHLLKHLTATMGNRFLRHTAFDILEDGRVEQIFFRQTKNFLISGAQEHRYQINTATRNYELLAKHEQLTSDANAFVTTLVHGVQSFVAQAALAPGLCTVALSARSASVPGLEAKLRAVGFSRQIQLPAGAAAAGAARIGVNRLAVSSDLSDVAVEIAMPLADTRRTATRAWELRFQKARHSESRPAPTHAIIEGLGHALGSGPRFSIGAANARPDLILPASFCGDDCLIALVRDAGRLWFIDPTIVHSGEVTPRVPVETGDRLSLKTGAVSAEVLFAHCPAAHRQGV
jgi:hypothetical protein